MSPVIVRLINWAATYDEVFIVLVMVVAKAILLFFKKKKKKKKKKNQLSNHITGPDISSGRASASGSGGRRFDPRPRHTKGVKNGTGSPLADARNKRVVPGRYKKAGKYLLRIFVMSHNSL